MKIVVIGGTGLIGSKTVAILRQGGHEVVAASPNRRQHHHRRGAPRRSSVARRSRRTRSRFSPSRLARLCAMRTCSRWRLAWITSRPKPDSTGSDLSRPRIW
jgi:nucleoside-diphosphate-sugar epimerase